MSTPPLPPNDTFGLTPPPPRSTLSKVAIVLAVTMGVTFGLCSITATNASPGNGGLIFSISIIIEAVCAIGLLVVGIIALSR
jgi:hypothetical protein